MKNLNKKDSEKKSSTSPKGEEEAFPTKDQQEKEKTSTVKLNDPNVPMRRKNKIFGDGKDWFDTHPDA